METIVSDSQSAPASAVKGRTIIVLLLPAQGLKAGYNGEQYTRNFEYLKKRLRCGSPRCFDRKGKTRNMPAADRLRGTPEYGAQGLKYANGAKLVSIGNINERPFAQGSAKVDSPLLIASTPFSCQIWARDRKSLIDSLAGGLYTSESIRPKLALTLW